MPEELDGIRTRNVGRLVRVLSDQVAQRIYSLTIAIVHVIFNLRRSRGNICFRFRPNGRLRRMSVHEGGGCPPAAFCDCRFAVATSLASLRGEHIVQAAYAHS
jgi:hypothetical protein